MTIIKDNIFLCEDCALVSVNNDFVSLDYHYSKEEALLKESQIKQGLKKLGPHFAINSTLDYISFDTHPCDCCKTQRSGFRYRFSILGQPYPQDKLKGYLLVNYKELQQMTTIVICNKRCRAGIQNSCEHSKPHELDSSYDPCGEYECAWCDRTVKCVPVTKKTKSQATSKKSQSYTTQQATAQSDIGQKPSATTQQARYHSLQSTKACLTVIYRVE